MSRFFLITIILTVTIILLPRNLKAQENDKECEELKKEITDLQDLLNRETATLQNLKDQLENQRNLSQKALDSYNKYIKVASSSWMTSVDEEFRKEILDNLAKGGEAIRNLNNAIDEANLNIQALKGVINDLLNKLANCGKPKKTAMKEKPSSNNYLVSNPPKFEVCAGAGYGFSFNGSLLGQNRTFTANDRTFDGVYDSWAAGGDVYIKDFVRFTDCLLAGVEFDYTYGNNYTWTQNTIGPTSTTTQNYEGRYTGYSATPFIQVNPCPSHRIVPYVDLGVRLNFSNSIKQNIDQTQTSNNNTTVTKETIKVKGLFTTGFDASLGVKLNLNNR